MSFTLVAFTFASLAVQDMPSSPGGDLGATMPAASQAPPSAQSARTESSEARPVDGAASSGGAANRAPAGSTPASPTAEGDRRICRRIVVSRSHRYQRVCLTAEEWRRMGE